jgi:hypothetical protein
LILLIKEQEPASFGASLSFLARVMFLLWGAGEDLRGRNAGSPAPPRRRRGIGAIERDER